MFQVISECYERKSLIITSNLEFSGWNTVLGDNRLTAAVDYCRISTEIDGIIEKNTVDMNRIMCYNEYVIRCRISTVRMEEALYE